MTRHEFTVGVRIYRADSVQKRDAYSGKSGDCLSANAGQTSGCRQELEAMARGWDYWLKHDDRQSENSLSLKTAWFSSRGLIEPPQLLAVSAFRAQLLILSVRESMQQREPEPLWPQPVTATPQR